MPQSINDDILTTFQAAKLCGVSHKSIERWIDSGVLKGFRTPGGHRRLNRSDLLTLIADRKTDRTKAVSTGASGPIRVLMVRDGPMDDFEPARQRAGSSQFSVAVAVSCFEAGVLVERLRPHVLVVGVASDSHDGSAIWQHVRNDATHSKVLVVAVADSADVAQRTQASGFFHATLVAPFLPSTLRSAIASLVENAGFVRHALADT